MLTPGKHKNKRGETVTITEEDGELFKDEKGNRYTSNGVSMFWSSEHERYFMDMSPLSDIDFDSPVLPEGSRSQMPDEERLAKLEEARRLIREV